MATQAQIDQHDNLIAALVLNFGRGLNPLFDQLFAELANLGSAATRTQILALFYPIRQYINTVDLTTIVDSNNQLNAEVIPAEIYNQTAAQVAQLRNEVVASVENQIQTEQQSIIETIVLAAIAGAALVPILRQLRQTIARARGRITRAFDFAARSFDGAFTLIKATLAGVDSFRYVGGTIPTTRDFCRTHTGKTMTRQEITRIWRNQTWGGKAPGNPFIVRGGYNCRHMFVPVKADSVST